MTVARILKSKPSSTVLTISPASTMADAAEVLADKGIGALVVSHDGMTLSGILSERDIVRQVSGQGAECLTHRIEAAMTKSVKTISPKATAVEALQVMTNGRFRHLPVMEDDEMIGVISIGDVVKYRIAEMQHENEALTEMIVGHG